jgi:phosphoglycerate dehydrogenase-like enzyme
MPMSPPPVVVVTEPEYRRGEPVFAAATALTCVVAPPAEDDLVAAIERSGAQHAVVGPVYYRDRLYKALPRGSVLARFGVGHESVDKARATEAGLFCTNTPDVLQQSVAELTMVMVGAAARHVVTAAARMRDGDWSPRQGLELEGKTLTIVGCGEIGRTVARIAAAGYGMRVIGYHRRSGAAPGFEHFHELTNDFRRAAEEADFVSLHIPGNPENASFMNRERLAVLPSRAWLINTARGSVLDESALFDALAEGRLAGAALDVFEREPYEARDGSRDFRSLPNVILLPHIGSNTAEANRRMAERALRNILLAEAGEFASMDIVNPQIL